VIHLSLDPTLVKFFQEMSQMNVEQKLKHFTCEDVLFPTPQLYTLLQPSGAATTTTETTIKPREPISITTETSIREACALLHKHSISSLPIYSPSLKQFTSQVEYFDLLYHLLSLLSTTPNDLPDCTITQMIDSISDSSVEMIVKHRPIVCVQKSTTLYQVVQLCQKVHRVVVLDDTKFIGVVSQSLIAAFITSQFGLRRLPTTPVWTIGSQSVEKANVITKQVISCTEANTVMDALFSIYLNKVSSIAILKGMELRGVISVTDIKMIFKDPKGWKRVFDRVDVFFKSIRMQQR
jgi:CBS domain-containing protein